MNQRSTGLVVGLVIFVILTVGLLASTIYFQVEATGVSRELSNKRKEAESTSASLRKSQENFTSLSRLITGDSASSTGMSEEDLQNLRKALGAEGDANVRQLMDSLRARSAQLEQENENLKKQVSAAKTEIAGAREEVGKAMAALDASKTRVEGSVDGYRSAAAKYENEVKETLDSLNKTQSSAELRRREEQASIERELANVTASRADLSARVAKLQETVDQYRIKPENSASLVDGRVVDVVDQDGQIFLSIGARQRVQPGMVFDVYDSPAAVQFDPGSGELIPGKARVQILKVEDETSTARIIPEERRSGGRPPRPVVKDDVIANAIYSPTQRYRFLVHGKFDVDNDGRATAAEAEYVRSRIQRWGGDVVDSDELSGDLDFVVMGVKPVKPFDLPSDADAAQYSAYHEQQKAFQSYDALFKDAQTARIPVLNWNRMQVLTNEGR